jgi:hypothetical protein
MDERDLPKAPLSLFHIVEALEDVGDGGDDGWTGGGGVEEEVWENVRNFKFTTQPSSTTGQFT